MAVFTLTVGTDTFVGNPEDNIFSFTPATLSGTDTLTGANTPGFFDYLSLTAGGMVTSEQFANVTNIERFYLSAAGNSVALTNGLVAGSSAALGLFFVLGGAGGDDTVDGSAITNNVPLEIAGSGGVDTLTGGSGDDRLFGGLGNDVLVGGGGNDVLVGNNGAMDFSADSLSGGEGNDTLYGEAADTLLSGGNGFDVLQVVNSNSMNLDLAAAGIEFVVSDFGNDTYTAASGSTAVEVYGSGGTDTITGGSGDDRLWGGIDNDILTGNGGADTLVGELGADSLSGGAGNDRLFIDTSDTFIDGGADFDVAYIVGGTGITLNMATSNLEFVQDLVDGNDVIDATAASATVQMFSEGGTDTLTGGSGDDSLWGGGDNDILSGNGGADTLVGGLGADSLSGGTGNDRLFIDASDTFIDGGADFDVAYIVGGTGITLNMATANLEFVADFVNGNDSIDASATSTSVEMYGAGGTDSLTGGGGSDLLFGGADADTLIGNGGADRLVGEDGADSFSGGAGNDVLYIDSSDTTVDGGADNDVAFIVGGSGVTIDMAASNLENIQDNVSGADTINGVGTGARVFAGGGDDTIGIPNSGFTTIAGGAGLDRLVLTTAAQVFDLTANASKITGIEVISLNASAGATLSLTNTDIPQINAAGNSLYVLGGADDTVNVGDTWTLISTTHTNAAVSGDTFVHYHNSTTNSDLYIGNQIATTINQAPAVATSAFAPSYTEDGAPTLVDNGFVVSDGNDTDLESALVSITGGFQAGDVLGFTPQFGIVDTNGAPEILALSGTATLAEWQTVLQSITFSTTSQAPGTSRTVSITVNDGDVNSLTVTKDIAITPVNDAPAGTDNTVTTTEGTPYVFTVADFGFTDTDANALFAVQITTLPAAGTLTINSTPVNAGDFIQAADITAGFLVYTPPAGGGSSFTFQVQDNGGVANGGVDLDQTANTLTIAINTPPVANDDTASATEAGGTNNAVPGLDPLGNLVTGVGTGSVADTDAEDPATALTVVAVGTGAEGSPDNGTVGVFLSGTYGQLRLMADGSYTYEVDQNNAAVQALLPASTPLTDIFHYTIEDTAGAPDSATLTISVGGANDLPQANDDPGGMTEESAPALFPVGANDVPDPDAGAANTIAITGTVIASGPGGAGINDGDATAVVVGNQIEVTLNGDFQALTASESATVQVPYTLTGNAGETDTATLTVTVTGVNDGVAANDDTGAMSENDAPTLFNVRLNDTLDVDHTALNTVSIGTVTASGPAGDGITGADVTTAVVGNQVQITLGADFQNLGDGETATIDVQYTLTGDQPGDTDTAALQVTVTGANDAPVAGDFTFNAANAAIGNTALVVNDATDGAPDPTGPQKTISGDVLAGATDVDTALSSLSTTAETINNASGTLIIEADGDFTYHPAAGFSGNAVFNYTLNDNDASGNLTDTGQITIEVAAPKVWYVDDSAAPGGDGTSDNPFNSLAALSTGGSADGLDGANDIIFVYGGTYASGIVLEDGQQLIGQSQGLTVNGTALEAASGGNPLINGAVVLASGNTIDGIDIGNTGSSSVFALSGANVGNAVFTDGSINNTSGGAININGSGIGMNLQFTGGVSSTGSSTNAISFNEARGTFNAGSGTLGNASGNTVNITGNNNNDDLAFTYGGALSDDGNLLVAITGQTGGTKDFNGTLTDGAGAGGGISLLNNTGATIRFDGGMSLTTTTSAAFAATGGGTVVVTDTISTSNILSTTTGTALNVANTTIHADDLTFQSISSNGASSGIVLNNTGTSGGLHVTGDGGASSNHSGGIINASTGPGVSLNSTSDVSLGYMDITNGLDDGIHGESVSGFTLNHANVTNNGNSTSDDGIQFGLESGNTVGLTGAVSITNSSVSGNAHNNVHIRDTSGTISSLTVTGSTFNNLNDTFGANSFLFEGSGTSTLTSANFSGNTVQNNTPQRGLEVQAHDTATVGTFTVQNNTFIDNGIHASFTQDGASNLTFKFLNNGTAATPITGSILQAVNVFSSSQSTGGTIVGTISENFIGNQAVVNSGGGSGISATIQGQTDATLLIDGNTIYQTNGDGRGIYVGVRGPADPLAGTLGDNTVVSDVTITNNTVTPGNTANNFGAAIVVEADNQTLSDTKAPTIRADIHGNVVPTVAVRPVNGEFFNAHIIFFEYTSAGARGIGQLVDTPPASATPTAQLTSTNTGTSQASGTIDLIAGPIGVPPLLAADGGVEAAGAGTSGGVITGTVLATLADAAVARWVATGLSVDQLAKLNGITITVADLGDELGHFDNGQIVIDDDAAGRGWFIDATPLDDVEFANMMSGTWLQTDPAAAPAGHFDLLTLIMHEMGHGLGLDDTYAAANQDELMYGQLAVGERRLPDIDDAHDASHDTEPGAAVFTDHAHLADEQGLPVKGTAAYDAWLLQG